MELLLVEDNRRISEFLVKGLDESGFTVTLAEDGVQARELIARKTWDLVLLDIMLPGIDGIELLQFARFKNISVPILVLSALGEPGDKVKALDSGADDYLSKPFHFNELLARINALIRRSRQDYSPKSSVLRCGDLILDADAHRVERAGRQIRLTTQEFALLKYLMEHAGKVVTRPQLLDAVWGMNHDTGTNVVDVYISYLRNKVEAGEDEKLIETIKGRGYLIRDDE